MATIPTTATSSICSSPPIPTIPPSLRTHHQCQPSNSSSLSSLKLGSGLGLVFGDSVAVEIAPDMAAVERAAARAVKEAAKWAFNGDGVEKRRKRRRRRRGFECLESEEEDENGVEEEKVDEDGALFGSSRSGFLSREEEVELCLWLKEGAKLETLGTRAAEARGNDFASVQLSSGGGKKMRMDEILCRRREAREKLTHCYRRLVVSIASGYQDKGLNLQDLIQEGSIGLLRGAEKFDPERGYKLSTYVYWWIKQAILKAIAHKSRLVRLPGSMWELMAKVAEASNVLSGNLRRTPTCEEIAEHLNLHVSSVRLVLDRSRSPASLDREASDKGRMTLQIWAQEILQGPDETTPEYMVNRRFMKKGIQKLLETLTAREAQVLNLYFGLNGETPMSFEEIGKKLKLSRERVRQINGIALTKLRNEHNVNDLKMYIV